MVALQVYSKLEAKRVTQPPPDIRDAGGQQVLVLLYPRQPEEALADVRDLLVVDGPAAVRVEGGEDPWELLLGGVEGGGLARLHPLLEAEAAGLVLVKHTEQGLRQHRVLATWEK